MTNEYLYLLYYNESFVCLFVRSPLHSRLGLSSRAVELYRNMSRRAVYFTGVQLRAITADKLRYDYFLLAVLSVLAISLTFSAPDPAVLQRVIKVSSVDR